MTSQTRTDLQVTFADGATPAGSDFADIFDSYISTVDTTAQSMASTLSVPALSATIVSADSLFVTTLNIGAVAFTSADITNATILNGSIDSLSVIAISAQQGIFALVSAAAANITTSLTLGVETTARAGIGQGSARATRHAWG